MKFPTAWANESPRLERYRSHVAHGPEASSIVRGHLEKDGPCSIVSLGDAEIKWWAMDELRKVRGVDPTWIRNSALACGMNMADRPKLLSEFTEAIDNSPIHLIQGWNWNAIEILTLTAFQAKNRWLKKPAADCNVVYKMAEYGDFFPILEGKRILIIGGHAPQQSDRMSQKDFMKAHEPIGCLEGYEIVGAVSTPARNQVPKFPYIDGIMKKISKHEFDLALVCAGGMAFIICERIRKMGLKAFDCGAIDRMILGEQRRKGWEAFKVGKVGGVTRNGTPL